MPPGEALGELAMTLRQVLATLVGLRALLSDQRQAIASGNLERLLQITADQEGLAARLAQLEQRRATLQRPLEAALGVRGLPDLGRVGLADPAEREAYLELLKEIRLRVIDLRDENVRASDLLTAATEAAGRTRAHLARLTGTDPGYGPRRAPIAPPSPPGSAALPLAMP